MTVIVQCDCEISTFLILGCNKAYFVCIICIYVGGGGGKGRSQSVPVS